MASTHSNDRAIHLSVDTPPRHDPLDGFPEPPPWIGDAVCATTDPEAFFPEKGGSTREAKQICASCTVQAECLDWALDRDERFGIWGGLSERERRRIKRTIQPLPDLNLPCRYGCGRTFSAPTQERTHASRFCQHNPAIHEESA
jgi:WhiB family transcriptional regulator, redox-sensing transcriptional regulator